MHTSAHKHKHIHTNSACIQIQRAQKCTHKCIMHDTSHAHTQGYVPSKVDVLHSRKATRGIQEYYIDIKGVPFRFVDVGGQRSQRQKWFQCFDEVTSILFLVASSAFDQTLLEDRVTNRLVESVNIFDTIVNNRCFRSVSIILFFNKSDLLIDKIKAKSIKDYFPDFQVRDGNRF